MKRTKLTRTKSPRAKSSRTKSRRPKRKPARRRASPRATAASLAAYAHDIRTALTGILALGELLASSNLDERERRWAAGIKNGAKYLAALTTLMVDAAKVDANKAGASKTGASKTGASKTGASKAGAAALVLQRETFAPRRLVAELAESLAARAETKGLTADVSIADAVPQTLVGDEVRLRAALENLIDNAVKFTERGAVRLEVTAAPARRSHVHLVFAVADSGIGLKAAEIRRLFHPFVQANTDIARRFGGSGLGLAVVKTLAKLMGGDLTVTSAPGRGSTFRLSALLPVASGAVAETARREQTTAPARALSVLCAEDNPYGRVILNTILTELGHRADFAGSGEETVTAAARGYDAVLMDLTLPGIDGLEAARRIRALGGSIGRTLIIAVSGRSEASDEAAARAAGIDGYLRKPLSPSALSAALAGVIGTERAG
jgi:two-component system, sensor histidine kinase